LLENFSLAACVIRAAESETTKKGLKFAEAQIPFILRPGEAVPAATGIPL
jgi:hypothetical protein